MIEPISKFQSMQQQKSNEIMAHAYNNLFGLKSTGLRFFSVWTMGKTGHGNV